MPLRQLPCCVVMTVRGENTASASRVYYCADCVQAAVRLEVEEEQSQVSTEAQGLSRGAYARGGSQHWLAEFVLVFVFGSWVMQQPACSSEWNVRRTTDGGGPPA